jgi:hypothetical protein
MTWPEEKSDYRVTAVVAFRTTGGDSAGIGTERGIHLAAKSNRKDGDCFLPAQTAMVQTLTPWTTFSGDEPILPENVVDLTSKLRPDGNYGRFAERSFQYGLDIQCEAGGPSWSGTVCRDALKNLGRCNQPQDGKPGYEYGAGTHFNPNITWWNLNIPIRSLSRAMTTMSVMPKC